MTSESGTQARHIRHAGESQHPGGCTKMTFLNLNEYEQQDRTNTGGRKLMTGSGGHDEPVPTLRFRVTPTIFVG
jgi:hypothetical protein